MNLRLRQKRYTLSLLEVTIALSLAAILMTVLFQSFTQVTRAEIEAAKLQEEAIPPELMQKRLTHLFDLLSPLGKDKEPLFYMKYHPMAQGLALHFASSGDVDIDPDFCHTLEHNLYLSKKGALCLSSSFQKKSRNDILLTGLDSWSLKFFNPKTLAWEETWEKKNPLPAIVKMSWTLKKKPDDKKECVFFLSTNYPIIYKSS